MLERIGDDLLLIGTAHVSPKSVAEVQTELAAFKPDTVCVELDALRLEALENKRKWEETPIHRLLKGDKLWLFLVQIMLASQQRRIGKELGVEPGAEMLAAVQAARAQDAELVLADRDIGTTMKRAYGRMRFREKWRLMWEITKASVGGEVADEDDAADVESLMEEDTLTQMMQELGEMAPSIKDVVIEERDAFLAENIRRSMQPGKKVAAVVGAGHLKGIRGHLDRLDRPVADLEALSELPEKRVGFGKLIGWGLPLLLLGLFVYFGYVGLTTGDWGTLVSSLLALVVWGGGLAAVGAILARGHVLSVLTAFAVAPLTILHPALAAGWFAGAVEAWVRTPTVKDFQTIAEIDRMRDFFANRVTRVLMVAALTNLGAMAGAFVAAGRIASFLRVPGG